ncbi:hypothetical protein DB31_0646 [Hyalangium minutum]|uniref:Uncharacterized protein n=1 Tax=Hyalangium minutum TaxID=394096 RepID=A0A085WXH0_9BACT|nr:hypothetical protein DB31_0646 [Hyalangium minutum]
MGASALAVVGAWGLLGQGAHVVEARSSIQARRQWERERRLVNPET